MELELAMILVADLEEIRDEMSEAQIIEFDNCKRLLLNPHRTNRDIGSVALRKFCAKYVKQGQLLD